MTDGSYGVRRITRHLKHQGLAVNHKRIRRLMRQLGIQGKGTPKRKKFCITTDSNHKKRISPNHLNRQFIVNKPNHWWVGDISYIWTEQGWCYISVVMDLFSRMIVGWNVGKDITADLVTTAFERAVQFRRISTLDKHELTFHSDRGVQYCSDKFRAILKRYQVRQSMSRRANCWDNSVVESFFRSLKVERIKGLKIKSINQLRRLIFDYINNFYNNWRSHSFLLGYSPTSWEIAVGMNPAIIENRNRAFLSKKGKTKKRA